jgi:PmbA protein
MWSLEASLEGDSMADMIQLAEKTVRYAMKLGASCCDVLVTDSHYSSAEIEKGSMKQANSVLDPGVAIRAFKNGCSGFSSCTGQDPRAIKTAAELAVSLAKSGTPDPDFKDLPGSARPTRVSGLFDKRISELQPAEIVAMAIELADIAGDDKRITSVNASVSVGETRLALANSNGFSSSQRLTFCEMGAESVARSGAAMFSGFDTGSSRKLEKPMIKEVGQNSMEHAILGLRQTKIQTGDYPVVVDPLAAGFVLSTAIGGGVNAESIQRKRSYLGGKLGAKLAPPSFTVHDDPRIEWATGSYSFDGEGTPSRLTRVIEKGVLKSYLYDSYTAGKDSVPSTGSSSRGGAIWSFRRPPSISSSNLVVKKGSSSLAEMLEETRKGVYLRLTYDYPNLASGEFSGLMMESYTIEHGELGPSIRQSTIGIGLLDLLERLDMIGKESRDAFGVRTPALRISRAKIGGSS